MNVTRNTAYTMTKAERERKAREFRAALVLAKTTLTAWAEAEGLTAGHVSQTLSGKRESRTLWEKVDAFTKKYMRGNTASAR